MLGIVAIVFFLCFGIAGIALAIIHEVVWWKRRNWRRVVGRIIEFERSMSDGKLFFSPEIEYEIDGKIHTFTSKYSESVAPSLSTGDEVNLLVGPDGKHAEHSTVANRIGFTLVPLAFGVLCLFVALTMEPKGKAKQDMRTKDELKSE